MRNAFRIVNLLSSFGVCFLMLSAWYSNEPAGGWLTAIAVLSVLYVGNQKPQPFPWKIRLEKRTQP